MVEIETKQLKNNSIPLQNLSSTFQANQQGVYDQINKRFNEQDHQQKTVQEARDILGESASALLDDQIYDLVNEMQYLVDTWLEEYEQKIFEGKTLKELLQSDL
jgi:hypothetical protein